MKVDLDRFREDGYLILRNVVSPEQLGDLRLSIELMVDTEKARSVAERGAGDPRGGRWYEAVAPRLSEQSIDERTADAIDFCLGETVYGVSHRLLNSPPVTAMTSFGAICSGLIDSGYTDWHRDASSAEQAPLSGMQQDLMENAPGYVQWNIPLYEDGVFWILPGSHKQPSTEAQRKQLLLDPRSPLEGGIPAELGPGDAIVYPNLMMHWGSTYTSRLRRTIHLGFRSFGGDIFPYAHELRLAEDDRFLQYLSAEARIHFERAVDAYAGERNQIEETFRALIDHDDGAFRSCLDRLHPGATCRMVSVVLLCRIAAKVVKLHQPGMAALSVEDRKPLIDGSPPAFYAEDMARRFTAVQAAELGLRFAELNRRLEADAERVHSHYARLYAQLRPDAEGPPDFKSRPLRTFNSEMPQDFDVDDFAASW